MVVSLKCWPWQDHVLSCISHFTNTTKWEIVTRVRRSMMSSNKVNPDKIEDLVNKENGHKEQAPISHRLAHKAAWHGEVLVSRCLWRAAPDPRSDKDTVTGRRLNVTLRNIWHWGGRPKLSVDGPMWDLSIKRMNCMMASYTESQFIFWDAVSMPE